MFITSTKAMAAALKTAAVLFDGGVDAVPTSPRAQKMIAEVFDWYCEQKEKSQSLSRRETLAFFGFGLTRLLKAEQDGELESYIDGGTRRYPLASICKRQIALALLSFPLDGDDPKARVPGQLFRKQPRARTEAELRGLAIGNAKRREDAARKRREESRA